MLVSMAGLEADEFSFDSVPGVGGPNASNESGANVDMEIDAVLGRLNKEISNREHQLRVLNDLLIDEKLEQETRPQGRPVIHGWISSYFGKHTSPFTGKTETHKGVDFAGKAGNDVVSVAGGVVTFAADKGGYGYLVEIDHGNGYITRYGHNQMIHVQVGEAIKRGQVIAKLGSTGRSTGPHVHFEVIKDGVRIDPMKFVE
jgi:murein DD-endopeptidase MepM/ murein hydrolase activator NlpD